MKTHLAVYEEGLFDLRGGKTFLRGGGANAPLKETLTYFHVVYMYIHVDVQIRGALLHA